MPKARITRDILWKEISTLMPEDEVAIPAGTIGDIVEHVPYASVLNVRVAFNASRFVGTETDKVARMWIPFDSWEPVSE